MKHSLHMNPSQVKGALERCFCVLCNPRQCFAPPIFSALLYIFYAPIFIYSSVLFYLQSHSVPVSYLSCSDIYLQFRFVPVLYLRYLFIVSFCTRFIYPISIYSSVLFPFFYIFCSDIYLQFRFVPVLISFIYSKFIYSVRVRKGGFPLNRGGISDEGSRG